MNAQALYYNLQLSVKHRLFTVAQKQAFLEDIAALIEDGIQVNKAVEIVSKTAGGLLTEVANGVLIKLAEGKQFADGLRGWFPDHIVEMVQTGEEGGTLKQSMLAAAASITRRSDAVAMLANSLIYPIVVMCLGFVVMVFINHSVFNSFAGIKPVSEWPSSAQMAVAMANFVQSWWWLTLLVFGGITWGILWLLHSYIGESRVLFDHFPMLSLYRRLTAARFMEMLGLLITNGVVFKKALKILRKSANPYLLSHILTMEYRLSGGKENIAEVLNSGLLNDNDLMRLRVIAQGKGFEHALLRCGRKAATDCMEEVNRIGKIVGALLLVASAFLAAYLVSSVYIVGMTLGGG